MVVYIRNAAVINVPHVNPVIDFNAVSILIIGVCKSLWIADFFELPIFEKSESVIRS
jgi:hypothetical protein